MNIGNEIVQKIAFQKKFSNLFTDAKCKHIFISFTKTNKTTIIFRKQIIKD